MDTFKRLWQILRSNAPDMGRKANEEESGFDDREAADQPPPRSRRSMDQREAQYYANLELPYGASFEEVKRSYRKLLKQYHPDRYHLDDRKKKDAEEVTEKLNEAYRYFKQKT